MDATTPRLTAAAPEGVATVDTPRPATAAPRDLAGRGAGRWRPVADALDLPPAVEQAMAARAAINGTTFAAELLASGAVSEQAFYGAVARVLALPFLDEVDADALVMRERDGLAALRLRDGVRTARLHVPSGQSLILIAPDEREFGRLRGLLADRPDLAARLRIVTPRALRRAVEQRCQRALLQRATHALFDVLPACSARIVMKVRQGFLAGALVGLYAALFFVASGEATLAVHVFFSLFFMACVVLRLLAVRRGPPQPSPTFSALRPKQMPRYSVLVALYREAEIVPELLVALGRLVWPRGKLEIKLVCEADDADTIAAIRAQDLRPLVEVIEVPKSAPRTKPKALAYALQMVTGDYVALYDAEDRPHPFQLVEAWQRFEDAWPDLACVQAPLAISNRDRGLLARMFAFEYSGLFNGMLPFLSRNELVLPLGGTSNHFRRDILEVIGGWDPFNVTEDADLGLRLRRLGYRTETISLPTWEVAPETLAEWLPQRTRWFKGWIQTWLVHMRDPRRLYSELGAASFIVSQILFAGMVVSALAHPLLLVTIFYLVLALLGGGHFATYHSALLGLDVANIALGYAAFLLLGGSTLRGREKRHLPLIALFMPVYWMLLSVAAWRALWQLYRDPHLCGLMYQRHQAGARPKPLIPLQSALCLARNTTSAASARAAMPSRSTGCSPGARGGCAAFA